MVHHGTSGSGKWPCWSQTPTLKYTTDSCLNIQTSPSRTEGSMRQKVNWTMHTCTMLGQTAHSSLPALLTCGRSPGDVKPRSFWCRSLQEPFKRITQNCSLNQMKGRVRDTSAALEKWGIGQWQRTRCSKYQVQHTTLQTLSLPVVLWTSFPIPRLPAYSQTFQ